MSIRQSRAFRLPLALPLVVMLCAFEGTQIKAQTLKQTGLTRSVPTALSSTVETQSSTEQWPGLRRASGSAACFPQPALAPAPNADPLAASPPRSTAAPPAAPRPATATSPTESGPGAALSQALVALMPDTNFGQTIQAHPTLFWYLPETTARYARFSLYEANSNLQPSELLYRSRFRLQGEAGIISLALPSEMGIPALQVDRPYVWQLQLYCDSNHSTRNPQLLDIVQDPGVAPSAGPSRGTTPSNHPQIEGILWRVEAGPELVASLRRAGVDPVVSYQQTEVWWDVVAALMAEYCHAVVTGGDRARFDQHWQELLQAVQLEALATAPIAVPCAGIHP